MGLGLIPARAGTTRYQSSAGLPPRAHPRSRGDHAGRREYEELREGSSPLARGPLSATRTVSDKTGLIPARAGTTGELLESWGSLRAHPRSRGDHCRRGVTFRSPLGSSPLARGPPDTRAAGGEFVGLIPARAGTTLVRAGRRGFRRAHPRSRGDHARDTPGTLCVRGSSPLARGPLGSRVGDRGGAGLIPARAGTTTFCCVRPVVPRAHPRSRGDHRRRV